MASSGDFEHTVATFPLKRVGNLDTPTLILCPFNRGKKKEEKGKTKHKVVVVLKWNCDLLKNNKNTGYLA